tara:strand:+ start:49 stop:192 length:144 start_codon:yes stop_codon:yes gene_type:complete
MMYMKVFRNPNPGKKPEMVEEKPKAKPKKTYKRKKTGTKTGQYSSNG